MSDERMERSMFIIRSPRARKQPGKRPKISCFVFVRLLTFPNSSFKRRAAFPTHTKTRLLPTLRESAVAWWHKQIIHGRTLYSPADPRQPNVPAVLNCD